jgi:hypothetical protein
MTNYPMKKTIMALGISMILILNLDAIFQILIGVFKCLIMA